MVMNYVPDAKKNPELVKLVRQTKESNLQWLSRAFDAIKGEQSLQQSYILLLGGSDTLSWRIRVGQSHLRFDMLPSYWSTSALLRLSPDGLLKSDIIHVPLLQPSDGPFATERNGVVNSPLSLFEDADHWKNIALIALPVPQKKVLESLPHFRKGRNVIDALEHVLRWLAFAWGVARTSTPIHEGIGLPTACMLESLYANAGIDLTPGLETRASSPEAIWATVRRWYGHYVRNQLPPPKGCYYTPHSYQIKTEFGGDPDN